MCPNPLIVFVVGIHERNQIKMKCRKKLIIIVRWNNEKEQYIFELVCQVRNLLYEKFIVCIFFKITIASRYFDVEDCFIRLFFICLRNPSFDMILTKLSISHVVTHYEKKRFSCCFNVYFLQNNYNKIFEDEWQIRKKILSKWADTLIRCEFF